MALPVDAQAEVDRCTTPDALRGLIRKAGKVVIQARDMELISVKDGELHWAGYYADVQTRWSAVAFAAAEKLARERVYA